MTPADVLFSAADVIERDGLYKGDVRSYATPRLQGMSDRMRQQHLEEAARSAPVSMLGAMERVIWGAAQDYLTPLMDTQQYRLYTEAAMYLGVWMQWNYGVIDVWAWNNVVDRTVADVVYILRQAAIAWSPPPF